MSKKRVQGARRREFLSALAAFGAATLVRGPVNARQAAGERAADAKRIDLSVPAGLRRVEPPPDALANPPADSRLAQA